MNDLRKAAELALAKLDHLWEIGIDAEYKVELLPEIQALRQALAQPEQEPVAWGMRRKDGVILDIKNADFEHEGYEKIYTVPLYTAPPKREWVGLTDEEIDGIYKTHHDQYGKCQTGGFEYERTIEAKLKEKNGGQVQNT